MDDIICDEISTTPTSKNDLYSMCYDIFSCLNIKSLLFLYIIYILLSSNVFSKYILEDKNIDEKCNINSIMLLRGIYLVIIFMFIQILLKVNVL